MGALGSEVLATATTAAALHFPCEFDRVALYLALVDERHRVAAAFKRLGERNIVAVDLPVFDLGFPARVGHCAGELVAFGFEIESDFHSIALPAGHGGGPLAVNIGGEGRRYH